ncbi:aldolase [Pseudoalteromonas maricaloris]|nr:aldolase [Pseudoalteromonas maricaloris]
MRLMCITNNVELALVADEAGVDYIFIDLEIIGKVERQGHLDTVISKHSISDVSKVANVLTNSQLLVRVNPIHENSKKEIDNVIEFGASIVMLPYFRSAWEVEKFIEIVNGRAKVFLLLETKEAVESIDSILEYSSYIDAVHVGLNDLHLSYNMSFMFEPFVSGHLEFIVDKLNDKSIPFGIGGVAELGRGDIPSELVLNEHIKLGSSMAILSRSFTNESEYKNQKGFLEAYRSKVIAIKKHISSLGGEFCGESSILFKKLVNEKVG